MPPELQHQVYLEVQRTRRRSGWPAARTLAALGVSESSYYRWLRDAAWAQTAARRSVKPVQPYEALPEEKAAVRDYALQHPGIRHRELAWRMVDEDVAYVSPSTVYRILSQENLVSPWRRRKKRRREPEEKPSQSDEVWATDLKYVAVGARNYYLITFIDEYSRYIVHHELLTSMDGSSVSLAAQAALETLPRDEAGELAAQPEIRSDNGGGYVSGDFAKVLKAHGLSHRRIRPHCPEENGVVERAQRTLGEAIEDEEVESYAQAQEVIEKVVKWYNEERLHSALGFLRPADYYRGDPSALFEARRRKLAQARHRRREQNLQLRQRTLPLEFQKSVS